MVVNFALVKYNDAEMLYDFISMARLDVLVLSTDMKIYLQTLLNEYGFMTVGFVETQQSQRTLTSQ